MDRSVKPILIIIVVIILGLTYTIASTYAVIINVTSNDGVNEIINKISIKDLVTDDNGNYNNTYYDIKNTLNITKEECDILVNSNELDKLLQTVLKSVVDYKVNKDYSARLSNDEIYNMIVTAIKEDDDINLELKNKVITNSSIYINDINEFLYDLNVSILGDNL